MTDQPDIPDEADVDVDPDEPETEAAPEGLPDDVRTGADQSAYNPPEDDPGAAHEPAEEPE